MRCVTCCCDFQVRPRVLYYTLGKTRKAAKSLALRVTYRPTANRVHCTEEEKAASESMSRVLCAFVTTGMMKVRAQGFLYVFFCMSYFLHAVLRDKPAPACTVCITTALLRGAAYREQTACCVSENAVQLCSGSECGFPSRCIRACADRVAL